jgi:hypothetical protein
MKVDRCLLAMYLWFYKLYYKRYDIVSKMICLPLSVVLVRFEPSNFAFHSMIVIGKRLWSFLGVFWSVFAVAKESKNHPAYCN